MKWSMGGSRFVALLPYCQRRVGARAARCSTMLATSEESQMLKLGQAWKRAYHHHHQASPVSTVGVQDGDAPSISIGHQVRSSSMEAAAVSELSDPATPTLATLRSQSLLSTEAAATELSAPATPTLAALRSRLSSGGPSLMDFITSSSSSPEGYSVEVGTKKAPKPKPDWMKMVIPGGDKYAAIKSKLRELKLNTVCEEAKCPNIGECWTGGETGTATATIMILGDTCTRGCRFCAVKTSRAPPPPDPEEPKKVAEAIVAWGLDYVVLTSVDRDDMSDQGSNHFAETVRHLKSRKPSMLVEALVPDFQGDSKCVERVATSGLDVFAHNIETVEELQASVRDRRANFTQSIRVLQMAKEMAPPGTLTKTSIMLGCGETPVQVVETMRKVREAGVDVMTLGQYMRPTKRHMPVSEYITPEAFEEYRKIGLEMGFRYVASGPMVRSSYKAGEFFIKSMIEADREKDKLTSAASL